MQGCIISFVAHSFHYASFSFKTAAVPAHFFSSHGFGSIKIKTMDKYKTVHLNMISMYIVTICLTFITKYEYIYKYLNSFRE